jgi:galactonate dehydratase
VKITDVKVFPIRAHRTFLFVKVETDEGISGVGESGLTWRERSVEEAIYSLKPFLIGADVMRTEHLWQLMFRGGFFPAGTVLCSAISAIDIALWDIKGKALNQPVYNLLGGLCRDKVICYPHNGGATVEALVESCQRTAAAGWKFARWGQPETGQGILEPSQSVRLAIKQFEAVRGALPEIEICFDVHTRLDPPDAIRLCREVEKFHPFFIEDPLRSESPHAYRSFVPHVHVPLAVGEQWASKWEFRQLIEEDLMHYARIDLCIVGGITEAAKIARWCEAHYINLAPHNPLGPVSAAAGMHLCLASTNVGVLELPRPPGTNLTDVFPVQVEWEDGYLVAPTRPGLGIEFDEEAAKAYPYEPGNSPQLRRLDGAFTNW